MAEKITRGSGNVFEDVGLVDAAEHKAKADLAVEIIKIIKKRRLTQKEAAILIGARQADISNLKNGQLSGFTMDRLIAFLLRLDRQVQIRITKPRSKKEKRNLVTVAA